MVQLVYALVLTQVLMELGHIAVIIGNKNLLIPNTVYPDLFQGRLDGFGVGGERHPLIYKLALVVLAQVRHTGFKYRYTVSLISLSSRTPNGWFWNGWSWSRSR